MALSLDTQWRDAFTQVVRQHEHTDLLKDAALRGRLGDWTTALTAVAVATCNAIGWRATAKRHPLNLLPVPNYEYLALDVMAFPNSDRSWRFPVAVLELENGAENRIAYSLWKVLCVRADLRIVFCYRRSPEQGSALVHFLRDEVIHALSLSGRLALEGQTLVVVGSRGDAATFPYGYFKWWQLETNIGLFRLM